MNIFLYNFKKTNTFLLIIIISICFFIPNVFYYLSINNQNKIDKKINENLSNRRITIFDSDINKKQIEEIEHIKLIIDNYYSASIMYKNEEIPLIDVLLFNEHNMLEGNVIVPKQLNLKINDTIILNGKEFNVIDLCSEQKIYMSNKDIIKLLKKDDLNNKSIYIIVDDYNNIEKVYNKIESMNIEASKPIIDTKKIDNLKRIMKRITISQKITSIITIILIIEIYLYIFKEEIKNISLMKIMGYNNKSINIKLSIYTCTLLLISFIINILLSFIINLYLIHFKGFKLSAFSNIINNKTMIISYIIISILFYFINKYKTKKLAYLDCI